MDGVRRPETGHGLSDFRVRPGICIRAPAFPALCLWASYFLSLGPSFFSANLRGKFFLQVHLLKCLLPSRNPWPQDPHNLLLHCRTRETGEAGSGVAGLYQGAGSCDWKVRETTGTSVGLGWGLLLGTQGASSFNYQTEGRWEQLAEPECQGPRGWRSHCQGSQGPPEPEEQKGDHPLTDLLCPQAVELTAFKASGTAPTPQVGRGMSPLSP